MVEISACPDVNTLKKLAVADLPPAEMEPLLGHLQECDACLAKLPTFAATDTLVDIVVKTKTISAGPDDPLLTSLIERLAKLAKAPKPDEAAKSMIFSCTGCGKGLKVKTALVGTKVKCPGCGQVTTVPTQTAAVGNENMRTVPPAPNLDGPTLPPKPADASNTPTNPALSKPDATHGVKPDAGHDASLTDFLAPPQADDELGRLGKYRILKILGAGGMGVVFLGEDPKLGRKVAIKAMLPHLAESKTSQQRFLREARTAATLEHDHIVPIFQVDEDRGVPYIVMPFLKGEPLDERLKREEPLPVAEIMRIGREVAKGLGAAHAQGLVHRDIKPANIWLEAPENRVKILDFGLARLVAEDAALTQQGAIIGTPAYMAPEQGRGENVDARCDLFSLGVVLYRMTTGQQPFQGKDTVSTLMAVAMNEPAAPIQINNELPHELSALVMNLLEKEPAMRISSAAEVVQAIQQMETKLALEKMASGKTEAMKPGDPKHGITAKLKIGEKVATRTSDPAAATTVAPRRKSVGLIAVALLAFVGLLLGGAGVYYWQTNNGVVRIEINDPDIKVAFDKNGPIISGADKRDIKLTPGEFGLTVERGDLKFETDKFILKRGETITLKIEWFKEGKLQVVQGDKVIGEKAQKKLDVAAVPPPGAYALFFQAKTPNFNFDSGVDLPSLKLDQSQPFTLEAFVTLKAEATYEDLGPLSIVGVRSGTGLVFTDGRWSVHYRRGGSAELRGPLEARRNQRIHVATVVTGSQILLFVDGKRAGGGKLSPKPFDKTEFAAHIGKPFWGLIEGVRISKSARYDKDFTPAKRFEPDADTLALYHFDEGSGDALKDSSGNGHHGKIVGAKWVKADGTAIKSPAVIVRAQGALQFSGKHKVEFATLQFDPVKPFTMEGWITPDTQDGNKARHFMEAGGVATLRVIDQKEQASWSFVVGVEGSGSVAAVAPLTTGKLLHVAGVRTDKEIRLYLDGKLVSTKKIKEGPLNSVDRTATLGGRPTAHFLGRIGEVRFSKIARYDKDFTPAQRFEPDADTLALYHFDEGSGDVLKDSSGNGHHGKIVGAKWVKADGSPIAAPKSDFALLCDSKNPLSVRVPSLELNTVKPLTIEGYFTQTEYGAGNQVPVTALNRFFIGGAGGKTWQTVLNLKIGGSVIIGPARVLDKRTHVAAVSDGQMHLLFVDGKLVALKAIDKDNPPIGGKTTPVLGYEFSGIIGEVRISKVARYTKDFTPANRFEPDADTLALYHCDEGSGDVLKDSSGNGHHGKIVGAKWVNADGTAIAPFQIEKVLGENKAKFDNPTYVPSANEVIDKMFEMAKVKKDDVVFVLGSGDGRILFKAAEKFGCRGVGIEINPQRNQEAVDLSKKYKIGSLVRIREGDALQAKDIGDATVVIMYMFPEFMDLWYPIAKEKLKPGTRIVSHDYSWTKGWDAVATVTVKSSSRDNHKVLMWVVPERPSPPLTLGEKEAKKQQEDWAAKLKVPLEATNKIGMKLILIPPAGDALPKPYYLGKYEVTQGEWENVMGYNPSAFGPKNPDMKGMDTSKFPVERVNWYDSVEFCNELSKREGLKPYYELTVTKRIGKDDKQIEEAEVKILGGSGYHVPTEAEWEHACRAGTKTAYHFGDKEEDLPEYAWFKKNSDNRPHAVGERKPNAFGLYDMHGNVWEWNEEVLTNAKGGAQGIVNRGGGWNHWAEQCAVSQRTRSAPNGRGGVGLRVARVP